MEKMKSMNRALPFIEERKVYSCKYCNSIFEELDKVNSHLGEKNAVFIPEGFVFKHKSKSENDFSGFYVFYSPNLKEDHTSVYRICSLKEDLSSREFISDYSSNTFLDSFRVGTLSFLDEDDSEKFRKFAMSKKGGSLEDNLGIERFLWDQDHNELLGIS